MQKLKDKRQCLWKGNMCTEWNIILKYNNEAEKKESLWQKNKPILPFTALHPNRSLIKKRKDRVSREEGWKRRQAHPNALVAEIFRMKKWSFRVSSSMEIKTLVTKDQGGSLASEVPSVRAPSRE